MKVTIETSNTETIHKLVEFLNVNKGKENCHAVLRIAEQRFIITEDTQVELEWRGYASILATPVGKLELSLRTYNGLERAGVRTLADLVQKTEKEVLLIPSIGRKCLREINEMLADLGLHLGMKL